MNSETKQCQNCKQSFVVEPEDFNFYKKINVPPPTWCPECRMIRRMVWRNERALYKLPCDLCGHRVISMFDRENHSFPIYCRECWWSDKWDPLSYGLGLDWGRPFFVQFQELLGRVPKQNLWQTNVRGGEFSNFSRDNSDIYLSYSVIKAESVYFSKNIDDSRWVFDCLDVQNSELCAEVIMGSHNYNCKYFLYSRDCIDSSFLFDCVNCKNCFLCSNLRGKEYCFENKQLTRDEYLKKIKSLDEGFQATESVRRQFRELVRRSLHKYAQVTNCQNSLGHDLRDCRNVKYAFNSFEMENVSYAARCLKAKDCMDVNHIGRGTQLIYESVSGGAEDSYGVNFTVSGLGGFRDVYFTDHCQSISDCFACVGLRNKQYCILNKQYTKEEYESLVPRIIKHMNTMPYVDKSGRVYRYGEFFPPELSPFAYNETIAEEYFPLSKEEALSQGYRWKDPEIKEYKVTKLPKDLPDHIKDVDDGILKETIGCASNSDAQGGRSPDSQTSGCTTAFRIIKEELQFYRKMNLPLPRLCPNCRHYQRLKQRNPLKLWHRRCMKPGCANEFETSYAPERKETIYCETCYNAEVV